MPLPEGDLFLGVDFFEFLFLLKKTPGVLPSSTFGEGNLSIGGQIGGYPGGTRFLDLGGENPFLGYFGVSRGKSFCSQRRLFEKL